MNEKIEYEKTWLSKNTGVLFLFTSVITLLAPYFLTQFSIWPYVDFSRTGSIGDTIGGITAPIINLFAAFLVYVAFREQIKANELQVKSLNSEKSHRKTESAFNVVLSELNWCSDEYDKVEYNGVKGTGAINELMKEKDNLSELSWNTETTLMFQRVFILRNYLDKLVVLIDNLDSDEYKAVLANKLLLIHRSKTRKYKSRIFDFFHEFSSIIGKSSDEMEEMLILDKATIEWLEKQRFKFHTSLRSTS